MSIFSVVWGSAFCFREKNLYISTHPIKQCSFTGWTDSYKNINLYLILLQQIIDQVAPLGWDGAPHIIQALLSSNSLHFGWKNLVRSVCVGALNHRSACSFLCNSQLSTLKLVRPSLKLFSPLHTQGLRSTSRLFRINLCIFFFWVHLLTFTSAPYAI